jgi:hypothetical protein
MNFLYRNALPILLLAGISTMLAQQIPTTGPSLPTPGQSAPQPPTSKPGPAPSGPTPLQQLPGPNGAATGQVVDDAGNAVAYARVFISQALAAGVKHTAAPPVITGPQASSSMTDGKGLFTAFLPPGSYVACAELSGAALLDPCHFATSAPAFSVAKGQILTGVKVVMAKGAILSVQINDPQGLLAAPASVVSPDCRVQVITAKGYRYEATITAHTATSRNHAIALPFGAAVTVQVISPNLTVNDASGKPVASAGSSVAIPATGSPGGLTFTVSGVKP